MISTIKDDIKARTGENFIVSSQLTLRQSELEQSIDRCNILEEKFKREPAEREESWDRREREVEKLRIHKEEALLKAASKAEDELQLLIIQNIHLQVLCFTFKCERLFRF